MEKEKVLKDVFKKWQQEQFFLIAGPCVIESEEMAMDIAMTILKMTKELKIPFIFKGSYRKANRSKIDSFTGIGDRKALRILEKVSQTFDIPVTTDVHSVYEAIHAANYVDVLQIPAFLCRQTDIIHAAGKTGLPVNIKKGQFMSPESMKFAIDKVRDSGNYDVLVTERGTTFGYEDLVVDYRGIPTMQTMGVPVILDVTHSLQRPNHPSGITGGKPQLIATMAKAGIAAGVNGIFLETHFDPANAKSDGANMLHIRDLFRILKQLSEIRKTINNF